MICVFEVDMFKEEKKEYSNGNQNGLIPFAIIFKIVALRFSK